MNIEKIDTLEVFEVDGKIRYRSTQGVWFFFSTALIQFGLIEFKQTTAKKFETAYQEWKEK